MNVLSPRAGWLNLVSGTWLSAWLGSQLEGDHHKNGLAPVADCPPPLEISRKFPLDRESSVCAWVVLAVARVPQTLVQKRCATSSIGASRSGSDLTDFQSPSSSVDYSPRTRGRPGGGLRKSLGIPEKQALVLHGGDPAWHHRVLLQQSSEWVRRSTPRLFKRPVNRFQIRIFLCFSEDRRCVKVISTCHSISTTFKSFETSLSCNTR